MSSANLGTAKNLMLLGACGVIISVACSPIQRDLTQLKQSEVGGTGHVAGSSNSGLGGSSIAGSSGSGGATALQGGTTNVAGATGLGGASNAAGANPSNGGTIGNGGTIANGGNSPIAGSVGTTGGTDSLGGNAGTGGVVGVDVGGSVIVNFGGAGGSVINVGGQGGVVNLGGFPNPGGGPNPGGTSNLGGMPNLGGSSNMGGATACAATGNEICNDGIDNDCNGTLDCPIVNGRYPEPGRASAGDDAWVQLTAPVLPFMAVECRSGKPNLVGNKPWVVCDTSNPTALKIYSMGLAEAKLDATNGVTTFEFRFVYQSGAVSDPRQMVYYAHNSLWDGTSGQPTKTCPVFQPDGRYFEFARAYVAPDTTTAPFDPADLQLKNPFIRIRFTPKWVGDGGAPTTTFTEIKVASLRHRFVVDSNRQMLLVTRTYQSTRSPDSCNAAMIKDHDNRYQGIVNMNRFFLAACEAIVMNKTGAGVCLATANGTIRLVDDNSSKIVAFLNAMAIPWPKSDPMMWQKLFDDRPGRPLLQFFSDKCATEDAACRTGSHPGAFLLLPDANDQYFTTP